MANRENRAEILKVGRKVIAIEARAVSAMARRLDNSFADAALALLECKGNAVVMGIGKSGLIGRKIAATMSSTGTPAVFAHPVECLHGDLGLLGKRDIAIALSYSGETEEIIKLIPVIKGLGIKIISLTGRKNSTLAKMSDIVIDTNVKAEACPLNSAPTASTTAMLAAGDALAIALMKLKHFGKDDFAKLHPGGALGRILTLRVKDIMQTGTANPVISEAKTVKDALFVMTETRTGAVSVVNKKGRLTGFFTDGNLRRELQKNPNLLGLKISEVMTVNPVTVSPGTMAAKAADILREKRIDNMPVIDEKGKPVGLLDERVLIVSIPVSDDED